MQNDTRKRFNAYREKTAAENGVSNAAHTFTAVPAVEQRAVATAQESHALLKDINMVGVTSPDGQAVGISIGAPIAGRTNTDLRRVTEHVRIVLRRVPPLHESPVRVRGAERNVFVHIRA